MNFYEKLTTDKIEKQVISTAGFLKIAGANQVGGSTWSCLAQAVTALETRIGDETPGRYDARRVLSIAKSLLSEKPLSFGT